MIEMVIKMPNACHANTMFFWKINLLAVISLCSAEAKYVIK